MKVEKDVITINFWDDILASLSPEDKRRLVEQLIWDEDIINDFIHQLTDGFATPSYYSNIHEARLRLASKMPALTQNLVTALIGSADAAKAEHERMSKWAYQLYHIIAAEYGHPKIPPIPDWIRPDWTEVGKKAKELLTVTPAASSD